MKNKRIYESSGNERRDAILAIIREERQSERLRAALEEYHPNDIANILPNLSEDELDRLIEAMGADAMSDILSYREDAGEFIEPLSSEMAADIIERMDADEANDALSELEDERRDEILELVEKEAKEDIELVSSYREEEFGSVMSTDLISVGRGATVKSAMRTLIAEAADNDNIYTVFVTEEDGSFVGAVDLKELISARSDTPFEELIYTEFPYVLDRELISENIDRISGYSEELIPVLSSEGLLLGVITSDVITELLEKELEEDYARLAALPGEEEKGESLFGSVRKRAPWLVALLFMGLAVSSAVGAFEGVVRELPIIVSFQSLILGMAGNVGTQSLAVTVRGLGDDGYSSAGGSVILRETAIALLNGLGLGLFSFAMVGSYLALFAGMSGTAPWLTGACVGSALCFAMGISGCVGSSVPMLLHRLGADPAVASGPLITTVNDLVAVISYYGLAWLFLLA